MNKSEIAYNLPEEKIAQTPITKRDEARLLVFNKSNLFDVFVKDISKKLPKNTLLIRNRSRVQPVRLLWKKEKTMGELVVLSGFDQSLEAILSKKNNVEIHAVIGNGRRWKKDAVVSIVSTEGVLIKANRKEIGKNWAHKVTLQWDGDFTFGDILQKTGIVPMPPYITKSNIKEDKTRYQTVFAKESGSSAAPTAGLHLTKVQFDEIRHKGIQIEEVVLHVGLGTFLPVITEKIEEHVMHGEYVEIPKETIIALIGALRENKNIFTIGTTSTRSIESLAWIARMVCQNKVKIEYITESYVLPQFVYKNMKHESKEDLVCGLEAIFKHLNKTKKEKFIFKTTLMITPGYKWQLVSILMTNFHQPGSTLLALVSSFTNQKWKKIYKHALKDNYRFLSYGDASLLFRDQ